MDNNVFTVFTVQQQGSDKRRKQMDQSRPFGFQRRTCKIFNSIHCGIACEKKLYLLYRGYLPVIFYVLLVTALILLQPNFSVSLIIFSTCMFMIFLSEAKLKHIIFTLLALTPIAAIFVLSKDYKEGENGGSLGIVSGEIRIKGIFSARSSRYFIFQSLVKNTDLSGLSRSCVYIC
jgi:cell division protein FtsW (lipid II flippase)